MNAPARAASPLNADESSLVAAAKVGEQRAFAELMRRNNRSAFRTAWSLTGNYPEAEDVLQEAYVKAFSNLERFAGESRFSTWLIRIVVNEALMRRRQRERRQATAERDGLLLLQNPNGALPEPTDAVETPERTIFRRELRERIQRALGDLAPEFRSVFVLRTIEEMSVEETADALGINQQTVKSRLFRARRQLRARLEREAIDSLDGFLPFAGARCAGLAARVLQRLRQVGLLRTPP